MTLILHSDNIKRYCKSWIGMSHFHGLYNCLTCYCCKYEYNSYCEGISELCPTIRH
jgi:hypothetical protein